MSRQSLIGESFHNFTKKGQGAIKVNIIIIPLTNFSRFI